MGKQVSALGKIVIKDSILILIILILKSNIFIWQLKDNKLKINSFYLCLFSHIIISDS